MPNASIFSRSVLGTSLRITTNLVLTTTTIRFLKDSYLDGRWLMGLIWTIARDFGNQPKSAALYADRYGFVCEPLCFVSEPLWLYMWIVMLCKRIVMALYVNSYMALADSYQGDKVRAGASDSSYEASDQASRILCVEEKEAISERSTEWSDLISSRRFNR